MGLQVVHLHCFADFVEGVVSDVVGSFDAAAQGVFDDGGVGFGFGAACSDGGEHVVDRFDDEFFELPGAAIADFFGDLQGGAVGGQRGELDEVGDLGAVFWVEGDVAFRVGDGFFEDFGCFVGAHAQFDGVAAGLAHFLSVGA